MKVLLINPITRLNNAEPNLPSGLIYIAAYLRREGHQISILDIDAHKYSMEEVLDYFKTTDFDVVGLTGIITSFRHQRWIVEQIKKIKPHIPVMVGGVGASSIPDIFMSNTKADLVVIGEGELTAAEVLERLASNRSYEDVAGICYRGKDGKPVHTAPRANVKDPDTFPFPAWDLLPIETYITRPSPLPFTHRRTMTFHTARGCPYQCTFCQPTGGHFYRYRSIDNVIAEMKLAKEKYNYTFAKITDECWPIKRERSFEFCEKVKALNIKWSCTGRANLVDDALAKAMADAGCVYVGMGYESANPQVLKNIKKVHTPVQERNCINTLRKHGIYPSTSYIAGLPGETPAALRETAEFIKSMDIPIYDFFYATPYPGTELYTYAVKLGKVPDLLKLVESFDEMSSNFLVNVSDMPDQELMRVKEEVEKDLRETYTRRHPIRLRQEKIKDFCVRLYSRFRGGSLKKVMLRRLATLSNKYGIRAFDRFLNVGEYSWHSIP